MTSYDMLKRAKWHLRKGLSMKAPGWPKRDPSKDHHDRCFVMLACLARGELDEVKRIAATRLWLQ